MRIATAIRSLALAAALSIIPAVSHAGVFVSIGIGAPPVLPVYAQPICPAPGYIWTPGYWSYDPVSGYYWVPGAWVLAPYSGALWTPGYWAFGSGGYLWHPGYWGLHIGFYGGVNYGFGYFGHGYEGGYWNHGVFAYNRSVTNVNIVNVHNVYNKTVINRYNTSRVSFNGGHGGLTARPDANEQRWSHEQHTAPLAAQHQNEMRASQNRAQFASVNHGRPENLARTQPVSFNRNASMNNRPANNTFNRPGMNNNATRPMPGNYQAATRPAMNNSPRPMANNQNFNRGPQQAYRPQAQAYHPQASQPRGNYNQPRSEPARSNGGGHEIGHGGGHGGRGR